MLEALFGSRTAERVLLYLANYGEGYAKQIADTFGITPSMAAKQLEKLEAGGILVARPQGRTRVFTWNPRFPLRRELLPLLERALALLPETDRHAYFRQRRRPRRTAKP